MVELDIIDDRANNERVLPQLCHEIQVVTTVEGDGDLKPFKVLRGWRVRPP
jgi:hypothetical protein